MRYLAEQLWRYGTVKDEIAVEQLYFFDRLPSPDRRWTWSCAMWVIPKSSGLGERIWSIWIIWLQYRLMVIIIVIVLMFLGGVMWQIMPVFKRVGLIWLGIILVVVFFWRYGIIVACMTVVMSCWGIVRFVVFVVVI